MNQWSTWYSTVPRYECRAIVAYSHCSLRAGWLLDLRLCLKCVFTKWPIVTDGGSCSGWVAGQRCFFQKGSFFFGDLSPGHVTFLEQVPDPPNNTEWYHQHKVESLIFLLAIDRLSKRYFARRKPLGFWYWVGGKRSSPSLLVIWCTYRSSYNWFVRAKGFLLAPLWSQWWCFWARFLFLLNEHIICIHLLYFHYDPSYLSLFVHHCLHVHVVWFENRREKYPMVKHHFFHWHCHWGCPIFIHSHYDHLLSIVDHHRWQILQ